jgi:TBC1 domain family member 16
MGTEETDETTEISFEDNEMLFCKNNVCVHPPAIVRQESDILHYPGYLTVTTKTFIDQYNNVKRPTLFLTWIPNTTLRKCPSAVENNLLLRQYTDEPKLPKLEEKTKSTTSAKVDGQTFTFHPTNPFLEPYKESLNQSNADAKSVNFSDCSETISISSSSDKVSVCTSRDDMQSQHDIDDDEGVVCMSENGATNEDEEPPGMQDFREMQPLLSNDDTKLKKVPLQAQQSVTSINITISNPQIQNHDLSPPDMSQHNDRLMRSISVGSNDENPNWMSPELLAYKHNLSFPESATASPIVSRKIPLKCRR